MDRTELREKCIALAAAGCESSRAMLEVMGELDAARDYPDADATDYAHPAWWRGHDHTTAVFCQEVNLILDGKAHKDGVANEPWEGLRRRIFAMLEERDRLAAAIRDHRSQKADDRCIEDDDRLYAALNDGVKCDRRVGDKLAMLRNCERFIDRRCEGGGWPTYAEVEAERDALAKELETCRRLYGYGSSNGDLADWLRAWLDTPNGFTRAVLQTMLANNEYPPAETGPLLEAVDNARGAGEPANNNRSLPLS